MVPLVAILALHVPIVSVTIIVASCLMAMDKQWSWVKVGVAAAFLNPLINIPLIYLTEMSFNNGAIGAAVATVATEILMLLFGLALLPRWVLGRPALEHGCRTVLAAAVMVLVIFSLRHLPLVALVSIGGAVYALSALGFKAITVGECEDLLIQLRRRVVTKEHPAAV
jgi:O-antigen/teichoic acid export membrane protein